MLAVIFGILKILGLLILGILGLILLVLCLILFVPICYRAELSLYERFQAEATVNWLFRAISLTVRRREATEISLRIFGIPLGKKEKAEAVAVEKEQSRASEGARKVSSESTTKRVTAQPKEEQKEKKSGNPSKPERSEIAETSGTAKKSENVIKKSKQPKQESKSTGENTQTEKELTKAKKQTKAKSQEKAVEESKEPVKKTTTEQNKKESKQNSKESKWKKFLIFLKEIPEKIKTFLKGLRARFGGIKKRLLGIGSNLQELNEKRKRLMEFLRKEENKRVFRLLKRQLVRFLRHVLPQKLSGKLRFGLGDPYLTGQVLTVVSPFYGFYGRNFALTPVFDAEELVLEGEGKFRGRIRIGTLLWIGLRILIDKDARRLWKTWKNSRR